MTITAASAKPLDARMAGAASHVSVVVREVPIEFQDRRVGASKVAPRTLIAYLCQLLRLYGFRLGRDWLDRQPSQAGPDH